VEKKTFTLDSLIQKINPQTEELFSQIIAEIRISGCKCPDNPWRPEHLHVSKILNGFCVQCDVCSSETLYEWKLWKQEV
jgi:hypothetical protein